MYKKHLTCNTIHNMTDTIGNTITTSSTYYPVNSINNIQDSSEIAYNSAYKTYKDDTETPGTGSYNSATTPSGVTTPPNTM